MGARARSREAAVWQTLAAKERLCEELDSLVSSGQDANEVTTRSAAVPDQWQALPALPAAWERKLAARRDAALQALADPSVGNGYRTRIEQGAGRRSEALLELEMALGLESPAELQALRLALQVRALRDRFQGAGAAAANSPAERLVAWCAESGVASAPDRLRAQKVFAALEKAR